MFQKRVTIAILTVILLTSFVIAESLPAKITGSITGSTVGANSTSSPIDYLVPIVFIMGI